MNDEFTREVLERLIRNDELQSLYILRDIIILCTVLAYEFSVVYISTIIFKTLDKKEYNRLGSLHKIIINFKIFIICQFWILFNIYFIIKKFIRCILIYLEREKIFLEMTKERKQQ